MAADIKIKRLGKKDVVLFQELILVFEEVFESENLKTPKKSYLKQLFKNPGFITLIALNKKEVVGGLTAFELPMYYYKGSEMFIYDIAIKTKYQQMGIGKKLLAKLQQHCKKNGIKEMFVAANAEDANALKFYDSAGGKAEMVVHFNFTADK
ncbi:MAG TPA: GNAT family N-acetyltransferase [Bacteroidia bacterium]|jgi:aminoglycoside 3-N-acetyltransferase I|nr:GNAT family N-acetyltransferase [Bacteroidia bacterium]